MQTHPATHDPPRRTEISSALEQLPLDAFIHDRAGRIRWQNDASRRRIGDWVGRTWHDQITTLFPADETEKIRRAWETILRTGEPVELSLEAIRADGARERHDLSVVPLRDGSTITGYFGVAVTRTPKERRRSSAELGLTARQLEVLQMLADGKSTDQIARELYLSKTTVRNHVAHILRSLRVHSRIEAIAVGRRAGLVYAD